MNSLILFLAQKLFPIIPDTRGFGAKRFLLRLAGARIGKNVRICSSVRIVGDGMLSIGDNTWVGHQSLISVSEELTIGKNVNIAPRVFIGTGTHEIDCNGPSIAGKGVSLPILIGDGAWLCANSCITAGVSVGAKSIIAAGAVVIKNVPDGELWGGVPAKKIKNLFEHI